MGEGIRAYAGMATRTLVQLPHTMKSGSPGEQIILKSETAFYRIFFCSYEEIDSPLETE